MGVSQNYGYLLGGPYNRDYSIWGSILGSPYLGKLLNTKHQGFLVYSARLRVAFLRRDPESCREEEYTNRTLKDPMWGLPKIWGPFLVAITRTIVFWGSHYFGKLPYDTTTLI